ncbi:MAG TPA: hypothetical protein VNQ76_22425 [Planctomicrobium sp.]|nr:hypothetical protein [Planctomicrobium sp.]
MIREQFGSGQDGVVVSTNLTSAIKVFRYKSLYENEKAVYLRLDEHQIRFIEGFKVPRLLDFHDELLAIEMEVVTPPFVVDFAGAYLDRRPPYSEEELEIWEEERRELFGDERWEHVQSILASFRRFGIYLNDVKPGNITFSDDWRPD